jgi:hypothetical protein
MIGVVVRRYRKSISSVTPKFLKSRSQKTPFGAKTFFRMTSRATECIILLKRNLRKLSAKFKVQTQIDLGSRIFGERIRRKNKTMKVLSEPWII